MPYGGYLAYIYFYFMPYLAYMYSILVVQRLYVQISFRMYIYSQSQWPWPWLCSMTCLSSLLCCDPRGWFPGRNFWRVLLYCACSFCGYLCVCVFKTPLSSLSLSLSLSLSHTHTHTHIHARTSKYQTLIEQFHCGKFVFSWEKIPSQTAKWAQQPKLFKRDQLCLILRMHPTQSPGRVTSIVIAHLEGKKIMNCVTQAEIFIWNQQLLEKLKSKRENWQIGQKKDAKPEFFKICRFRSVSLFHRPC